MATKGRMKNPALEAKRNVVVRVPDVNKLINGLITTPKIHAGYLYQTKEGHQLLQLLCRLLSGTKTTYIYNNWEEFGIQLGLDPIIIKSINYGLKVEDPTSYVLLAYVQNENATIENILYALYEIKRLDILNEIAEDVQKVNYIILRDAPDDDFLKPKYVPDCPFVLKKLTEEIPTRSLQIISEKIQQTQSPRQTRKNRYAKTVLLTYASDGEHLINDLLAQLRKPRNDMRLGILVLNEQLNRLNVHPEEFIFECFAQIDYVFPIVTKQYIREITTTNNPVTGALKPDHKYIKYIYRLMSTHYLRNGCRNTKVRSIVPDDTFEEVIHHPIMDHSLFQVWVRLSDIESLVDAVLKFKF